MKATKVLCDQHRRLEQLASAIQRASELRIPLLLELVEELMAHAAVEDHFFYWAISDALAIPLDPYHDDHARLKNALLQLVLAESDDTSFERRLRDIVKALEAHVALVERSLLPTVEERMTPANLETLGERMISFHAASMTGERELGAPDIRSTGTEDA